ncbi:PASTA domain-containing protein [Spongiactinospora sp. TRM90649]|uniref:protein kinase domain-containing protein n=1 Tax=Spongiactinospora sp. TRM90649 TaxID=3031114 RepID=UPI0023F89394|nr:PASTA domain-containing protein [Spongiactinospora sp. TRM90649]MDF5753954.1 PASTA domain-containing protein [Spongiactinospora sp. TRM90649]
MPQAQPLKTGDPVQLGIYQLIGRLGEGGQGVVFLATRPCDGERYAVKALYAPVGEEEAAFLREAELAKQVARFCTAQVIDAGVLGGRPYIVSEYVDGPSLHRDVALAGPKAGGSLERLAVGTATALAAIHQAGIVHRDFKPQNVLLGPDGPRVIDFGLARALDAAATLSGRGAGTPAYMAPEQVGGEELTSAVDVFAWGATICFAANGHAPFGQDSVPAVLHRILTARPETGRIAGRLRALIECALEKNPADRPSGRELVLALLGEAPATGRHARAEPVAEAEGAGAMGAYYLGSSAPGITPERPFEDAHPLPVEPPPPSPRPADDDAEAREPAAVRTIPGRAATRMSVAVSGALLVSAAVLTAVLVPALTGGGNPSGASPAASGPPTTASASPASERSTLGREETQANQAVPPPAATTAAAGTVRVPFLTGMDRAAAVRAIKRAGLVAGPTTRSDSPKRMGQVLATTPAAGSPVHKGSAVLLNVSAGVKVPTVTGLRRKAAEGALGAAGLTVGDVIRTCSHLPTGQIVKSDPAGGARTSAGSPVSLVVARQGVTVPAVTGTPETAARAALEGLGLAVRRQGRIADSPDQVGMVLIQSVPEGTCVDAGERITLTVGLELTTGPPDLEPTDPPSDDTRDPTWNPAPDDSEESAIP